MKSTRIVAPPSTAYTTEKSWKMQRLYSKRLKIKGSLISYKKVFLKVFRDSFFWIILYFTFSFKTVFSLLDRREICTSLVLVLD